MKTIQNKKPNWIFNIFILIMLILLLVACSPDPEGTKVCKCQGEIIVVEDYEFFDNEIIITKTNGLVVTFNTSHDVYCWTEYDDEN
jgi:lipoprotein NlpI